LIRIKNTHKKASFSLEGWKYFWRFDTVHTNPTVQFFQLTLEVKNCLGVLLLYSKMCIKGIQAAPLKPNLQFNGKNIGSLRQKNDTKTTVLLPNSEAFRGEINAKITHQNFCRGPVGAACISDFGGNAGYL
jgi:hypothetical protein